MNQCKSCKIQSLKLFAKEKEQMHQTTSKNEAEPQPCSEEALSPLLHLLAECPDSDTAAVRRN